MKGNKMTDKEYEKYLSETDWGKELVEENLFNTAIRLLRKTGYTVNIIKSRDSLEEGHFYNVIIPSGLDKENGDGFWLNAFKTKKACEDFCKKIGWKIIEKGK